MLIGVKVYPKRCTTLCKIWAFKRRNSFYRINYKTEVSESKKNKTYK